MTLTAVVFALWGVFWLYWLFAAIAARQAARGRRTRLPGLLILVAVVLLRVFRTGTLPVHTPIVRGLGVLLFLPGLSLAVWARIYLGRNWGMPMTEKDQPELVTSGPYGYIRHPIYSGLLVAIAGTAIATNLYWLIALGVLGTYFIYSATVEERIMTASFPAEYPSYKARTKMLIPFLL